MRVWLRCLGRREREREIEKSFENVVQVIRFVHIIKQKGPGGRI